MNGKPTFLIYLRYEKFFDRLGAEQTKKLIGAMFGYVARDEEPDSANDDILSLTWSFVQPDLERDGQKWQETRAKRIEAGREGGLAKAENKKQV